jgi:hypothetical protein
MSQLLARERSRSKLNDGKNSINGHGFIGPRAGPIVLCGSPRAKVRVQFKTFGIPNKRVPSVHRCAQGSEPCRYLFRRD